VTQATAILYRILVTISSNGRRSAIAMSRTSIRERQDPLSLLVRPDTNPGSQGHRRAMITGTLHGDSTSFSTVRCPARVKHGPLR